MEFLELQKAWVPLEYMLWDSMVDPDQATKTGVSLEERLAVIR